MSSRSENVVQVAVGVIVQTDQTAAYPTEQVLICWRDAALHQGNRYEFPGGKVETHETPQQALHRELLEEINIEVQQVVRAQQLHFTYPEKIVCLHIFKVSSFLGQPQGQQKQAVRWVDKTHLDQYRFPDANRPILRMVMLPDQYVISRPPEPDQTLSQWIHWHAEHVPQQAWLYVRNAQLDAQAYQQAIVQLHQLRPDLNLMAMSAHVESLQAVFSMLRGIHFSQHDLMAGRWEMALPESLYRIAACHDELSIKQANQAAVDAGLDAIVLSPLQASASHPEQAGMGWLAWQQLCALSTVPVYALGGVKPSDLHKVQQLGGFGVAGIRAFIPN